VLRALLVAWEDEGGKGAMRYVVSVVLGLWSLAVFFVGYHFGSLHQHEHMKTCPDCREEMRKILS
jgi:hypothetical protein